MRFLIPLCFFVFLACDNNGFNSTSADVAWAGKSKNYDQALEVSEEMEIEPPRSMSPVKVGDVNGNATPASDVEIKIIRTGNMKFEVSDLDNTKLQVDTLLKSYKGYYESEIYNAYGNRRHYHLKIRVPNAHFEKLISNLEAGTGKLVLKDLSARDVTTEYVDLNIRLESNLAYLAQYKEVLKKARTIKEILEVKEKIRHIEEEIESKKGRIKFLNNKVSYSTLSLELTQLISRPLSNQPSFFKQIGNAFKNGISGFLSFIIGLVNFWPFILLIIALIIGRKKIWSWIPWRRKKSS